MITPNLGKNHLAVASAEAFKSLQADRPGNAVPGDSRTRQVQFNTGSRYRTVIPIRASSVSTLVSCPARWKAIHLDHLPTRSHASAKLGTAIHSGVAAYDRARMLGNSDRILEAACEAFRDELAKPESGVVWEGKDFDKSQTIGAELIKNYAEQIAPSKTFVAVEQKCPPLDLMVEGIILRLTGSLDRIHCNADSAMGITDFKSGEAAVRADGRVPTAQHRAQVGVYEILARYLMGREMTADAEIIGMQTTNKARVGVGVVHGAAESLIGTDETPGTLVYVAKLLKEGIFYGNPSDILCGEKFCPVFKNCRFRE